MSRASNNSKTRSKANRQQRQRLQGSSRTTRHILLNLGYQKIISQPSLQPSDGGSPRPDFVLMPTSGKLCDILKLRLPRVPRGSCFSLQKRFHSSRALLFASRYSGGTPSPRAPGRDGKRRGPPEHPRRTIRKTSHGGKYLPRAVPTSVD